MLSQLSQLTCNPASGERMGPCQMACPRLSRAEHMHHKGCVKASHEYMHAPQQDNNNTGAQGGLSFRSGAGQVAFNHLLRHSSAHPAPAASSPGMSGPWPTSCHPTDRHTTSHRAPTTSTTSTTSTTTSPVALASSAQIPFNQSLDTRGPSQNISMTPVDTTAAVSRLRTGHSNGHGTSKRSVGVRDTRSLLHGGLAYGSGGTGSAGGLSFRSGGGQISFRGPRHSPMTAAVKKLASQGVSGQASFRLAGCASFRNSSAASTGAADISVSMDSMDTAAAAAAAGTALGQDAPNLSLGARTQGSADGNGLAGRGPQGEGTKGGKEPGKLQRLAQQLQSYGLAGVVAYGLLNTLWYTVAFMSVWLMSKIPRGQGAMAAAQSFLTVMAVVWAGSQVTKVPRAGGALLLAPVVDKGLNWLQECLGLKTKQKAFVVVLTSCMILALTLFATVVLAWA